MHHKILKEEVPVVVVVVVGKGSEQMLQQC